MSSSLQQTLTDNEKRDFLSCAAKLGFSTICEPRSSNLHPAGQLSTLQEQQISSVLSDYPEFIVPVYLSDIQFLGLANLQGRSPLHLLQEGAKLVETAGWTVGDALGPTKWVARSYEDYAYVDCVLRGTSKLSENLRRQGFLAVCRGGVAIVGISTTHTPPHPDPYNLFKGDTHALARIAAQKLPPEAEGCKPYLVSFIPYERLEAVRTYELTRFDGLACLFYGFDNRTHTPSDTLGRDIFEKQKRALSKAKLKLRFPYGGTERLIREFNQLACHFADLVISNFNQACRRVEHGISVASGTGLGIDGEPRRILFSSALGIELESGIGGSSWFVESPFTELEAALDLVRHYVSGAPTTVSASVPHTSPTSEPANETEQQSTTEQLERLSSLYSSGMLSEAEFAAAKARLLEL